MPTYDYKCEEHGYFEAIRPMSECTEPTACPTCGEDSKKVIISAPRPLIEAMADAGCPGAFHTSGDRMTKRHRDAGQGHSASENQKAAEKSRDQEMLRAIEAANR